MLGRDGQILLSWYGAPTSPVLADTGIDWEDPAASMPWRAVGGCGGFVAEF